jgi:predicted short-subunit dehydrogenase-like oxidoreductase (DUF2520 family)
LQGACYHLSSVFASRFIVYVVNKKLPLLTGLLFAGADKKPAGRNRQ